jgi:hypothetical protein
MNQLSAIRTFSNPGFSPAKSTRIYADRWYLVEMQDIERDPRCDYIGLAETSTIYLYNGMQTRRERDSHLNHCNKIIEYTGNVFALTSEKMRLAEYYPDLDSANYAKAEHDVGIADNLRKALESLDKQDAMTDSQILAIYGNCKDWPGNEAAQVAKFRQDQVNCRIRNLAYWKSDIIISQIK